MDIVKRSIALALLLVSASADQNADRAAQRAFLKAMAPVQNQAESNGYLDQAKARLYQNIFSKAQPVGDRHLADVEWDMFGFDVTEYSMKYTGCSTVKAYSDELADEEESDTVLAAKKFVIFRLCPSDYCNKYSIDGCSSNYGDYALPIEDYMEFIQQYNEEKYDQLCQYCMQCMGNNGRRLGDQANDDAAAAGDDAAGDDANNDDGDWEYYYENNAGNNDDGGGGGDGDGGNDQNGCGDDLCDDLYDYCYGNNGQQGNNQGYDVEMFFECAQVDLGDDNGLQYYIGPHCQSDGFTIGLGVYSDENCGDYVDNMSVSTLIGYTVDENEIARFFPKDCMSCKEGAEVWQQNQNNNDNQDGDEVAEICENLYEASAKCNKNIYNVNSYAYVTQQQLDNEEMVCQYIKNLKSETYDESGEIILNTNLFNFNFSNWNKGEEYAKELNSIKKKTSPGQVAALIITIFGCMGLWIWACCLHSALARKNIPWRPRRHKDIDPTDISRQNSGIVLGRSRSGPNATLL